MRIVLQVIAGLTVLIGVVWVLQGLNILPGSFDGRHQVGDHRRRGNYVRRRPVPSGLGENRRWRPCRILEPATSALGKPCSIRLS